MDDLNFIEESNVFGDALSDSLKDKLVFKNYSITRLIKEGEFLNKVLDKEEIVSDVDKLLNLCAFMNLSMAMVSYISNVLDLSQSLAKDNDNINHLNGLLSCDVVNLNNADSIISSAPVVGDLLTTKLSNSNDYNLVISNMFNYEFNGHLDNSPINLVIGGSCYSMFLKLNELSKKVLELNYDVCKDLRFTLENKHPISLKSYNEVCCAILNCSYSLFKYFMKLIDNIKSLVDEQSNQYLNVMEYLNYSKSLVDHFRYLDDCVATCDRVIYHLNNVRKSNMIGSRRSKLITVDFNIEFNN